MTSSAKMKSETVKEMMKEAYIAGYEGCIDLADEEVERILKKYIAGIQVKEEKEEKQNYNFFKKI